MKKKINIFIVVALLIMAVFSFIFFQKDVSAPDNISSVQTQQQAVITTQATQENNIQPVNENQNLNGFFIPLERSAERVSKKPFGIFVSPQNSPVAPERFSGYHTGTDFEIFPEELNADVSVKAVCSGKLALKRMASGYGGVIVQNCVLEGAPITVVYGHLSLLSVKANVGDEVMKGDQLGILGKAYSSETDGERKHLHLAFHKGDAVNILGYVQNKSSLSNWINPCLYVCK